MMLFGQSLLITTGMMIRCLKMGQEISSESKIQSELVKPLCTKAIFLADHTL